MCPNRLAVAAQLLSTSLTNGYLMVSETLFDCITEGRVNNSRRPVESRGPVGPWAREAVGL